MPEKEKVIRARSADGTEYAILGIDFTDIVPGTMTPRTLARFETVEGERVRHVDDDTFILISTGETLKRVR